MKKSLLIQALLAVAMVPSRVTASPAPAPAESKAPSAPRSYPNWCDKHQMD